MMNRRKLIATTATSLFLLFGIASITTSMFAMMTTNAYAQGRACPEGFELNKGVCQTEPTLTCEYIEGVPRTPEVDENGDCVVREYTSAVCLNEEGTAIIGHFFPGNECIGNVDGTNQVIPDAEPECKDPGPNPHPINTAILTTERGTIECVFFTNVGPAAQECNIWTLNRTSGLCEIKPGNRN